MHRITALLVLCLTLLTLPGPAAATDDADNRTKASQIDAATAVADREWQLQLRRDIPHHIGVWSGSTAAVLGLQTGFYIASAVKAPGWFQGATVNLLFLGVGVAGWATNGLVLEAVKTTADRHRFAHYARRGAIAAMAIGSGMVTLVAMILPPLNWAGWFPEAIGLLALPVGAFTCAGILAHWAAMAEPPKFSERGYDPKNPRPQVVAAGPTGFTVRF